MFLTKIFRLIVSVLLFLAINSCTQLPLGDEIGDITKSTAKKILESQLKEYILNNAPILPSTERSFETVDKLPGVEFKPDLKKLPSWTYNNNGEMLLSPGDYVIPVWNFCLKAAASSPSEFIYTINKIKGSAAKIIHKVNSVGLAKYSANEIQNLIWSLQAGIAYNEMSLNQQKIIDDIASEYKANLHKSFYKKIEDKWNFIADKSQGIIPNFNEASGEYIAQLGTAGEAIIEIRRSRNKILSVRGDYESIRREIDTRRLQQKNKITPWSKISDRVYTRFVTKGHFQQAAILQVRVMPASRGTAGIVQADAVAFDILSLMADPNNPDIQALTLVPLVGFGGVATNAVISSNPYTIAAVMAALLAAQVIDWDAFFDLADKVANSADQAVKDMIKHANDMLNEKFNENEKELRENKIISGKNKSSDSKFKNPTREYKKSGDDKTLQDDFDKLPGEKKDLGNGKEYKELPSGRKAVKRPREDKKAPTLEIQPPIGSDGTIKVRYDK